MPELERRGLRAGVLPARLDRPSFDDALGRLLDHHDLVLVQGPAPAPLPTIWLSRSGDGPPDGVGGLLAVLEPGADRPARLLALLETWLEAAWAGRRRLAGVLVGGKSRRMGRPKPTVGYRGRPLVERVVAALEGQVDEVFLLGRGSYPESLEGLTTLADAPDAAGPMAGILAALRWAPRAAWVIAACDLPLVTREAIAWLLGQRAPGRWAVMPSLNGGRLEPLLAVYEPQARPLLERLAARGVAAPRFIVADGPVHRPRPPLELCPAWRNVNTPEQLRDIEVGREDGDCER
jgi:molybdopterin-guanine dinucleotide biosynthesis protein A